MNVLGQILDDRDSRRSDEDAADELWLIERGGIDPAARRESWRRWLRKTLEETLQWPRNEASRERLIGQCIAELTVLARQLRGRGWLLEGKALSVHVKALVAPIAKAQRAGKIKDFWPYFGEAVSRYVGANAEEIQAHARQSGAEEGAQTMAGALAVFGIGNAKASRPSLTEVIADRDAQVRRERSAKVAEDKKQLRLL
jgi:hypothetical protein